MKIYKPLKSKRLVLLLSFLLIFTIVALGFVFGNTDIQIVIDDEKLEDDILSSNINGRMVVEMDSLLRILGVQGKWDKTTGSIEAVKDDTIVTMKVGDKTAFVDEVAVALEVAPQLSGDEILIPLRFVAESFNALVEYDEDKKVAMVTTTASVLKKVEEERYPFSLPPLKYDYDALEPYIDEETMKIHHTAHHQAYINNANNALEKYPELHGLSAEEMLRNIGEIPETIRETIRNNVGGHVNHTFFWDSMTPNSTKAPAGELLKAINKAFGSLDNFKTEFSKAGATRFGSGWAWLVVDHGELKVISTPNQDSPLMNKQIPILGLDVWEHAYYLKYQNRRGEYLDAFWNIVDWEAVEKRFEDIK